MSCQPHQEKLEKDECGTPRKGAASRRFFREQITLEGKVIVAQMLRARVAGGDKVHFCWEKTRQKKAERPKASPYGFLQTSSQGR